MIEILIRQETFKDYDEVYKLVSDAFKTAEYVDGDEQDLVVGVRKGDAYIPELSLVAEIDGEIVGHIMFSKMKVGSDEVLALEPLSIKLKYQKQGIGSALIVEGHRIAKSLGYSYSVVFGSERYYSKFGYMPAIEFGIKVPESIPKDSYMAIKLLENAKPISGEVTYAKEFGM